MATCSTCGCTIGWDCACHGTGEPPAWYVKKAATEALALVEAFCLRRCPEEGACRGCPLNRAAELLGRAAYVRG